MTSVQSQFRKMARGGGNHMSLGSAFSLRRTLVRNIQLFCTVFFIVTSLCLLVSFKLYYLYFVVSLPTIIVHDRADVHLSALLRDCSIRRCFDVSRCSGSDQLAVYVYPDVQFTDRRGDAVIDAPSLEYVQMLDAVRASRFAVSDPSKACIFLPAIDTLNMYRMNQANLSSALDSLTWFGNGSNHLVISMLFDAHHLSMLRAGDVMVAGGGFHPSTYRHNFDVSIPFINPRTVKAALPAHGRFRQFTIIVPLVDSNQLEQLFPGLPSRQDVLVLERCRPDSELTSGHDRSNEERKRCSKSSLHSYPAVLLRGDFCLLPPIPTSPVLVEALRTGCIPVVLKNSRVLPFAEGIDWTAASIEIHLDQLSELPGILRAVPVSKKEDMRLQGRNIFQRFFQSVGKLVLAVLQTVEDRLATDGVNKHSYWNKMELADGYSGSFPSPMVPLQKVSGAHPLPLFMLHPSRNARHFTAVILSYDRFKTLIRVLKRIDPTPSLIKIIVVWNNQKVPPPQQSAWPKLNTSLQVLQGHYNRLNNRFIPFKEIETDCILALDDDIEMVTPDELEFGFQVWKEFPDRLVGFPGRLHNYNSSTRRYQYSSKWGSELSMVLTGAAFHHKYYSYLYTYVMPKAIRHWINKHMNCEDIAMNYLVAAFTGKPPIKATPKKRFRCERCSANESLWDGPGYFVERNLCLNNFTRLYGSKMPLIKVEYRADPVLYNEATSKDLPQRFHQVGSL